MCGSAFLKATKDLGSSIRIGRKTASLTDIFLLINYSGNLVQQNYKCISGNLIFYLFY